MKEKRKYRRYKVPAGRIFVFNHFSTRVGWIRDISRAGVSFECTQPTGSNVDPEIIDIFSYAYDRVFLPAIPCRKVFEMGSHDRIEDAKTKKTIVIGLHFERMNDRQKEKISDLIEIYILPEKIS